MIRRLLLVLAVIGLAQGAFAVDFGLRFGKFDDINEDFIVGAELAFPLRRNLTFNPSLEYLLADQGDTYLAHADLNYNFNRDATITPYLGLGVGLFHGEDTEEIFSANAGIEFRAPKRLRPYLQVRYLQAFSDSKSNDLGLFAGVRF